jgi:hypothetical protein
LAEQVVDKLVKAGLIPKTKASEVLANVKSGSATSQDWKLWIDLGQAQAQGGKDGKG